MRHINEASRHFAGPLDLIVGLPELPDGWEYERHAFDLDVVHVVWHEHGAESINFRTRTTAPGFCAPLRKRAGETVPTGHKWREKLVMAVVSRMQLIWTPNADGKGRE